MVPVADYLSAFTPRPEDPGRLCKSDQYGVKNKGNCNTSPGQQRAIQQKIDYWLRRQAGIIM